MINFFTKYISLKCFLRGIVYHVIFFKHSKGLRIDSGFRPRGKIELGSNVNIGRNVVMFHNCKIGNNVKIGESVELRVGSEAQIEIGCDTTINRGTVIYGKTVIGKKCSIAPLCNIIGSNHNFNRTDVPIKSQGISRKGVIIGDNVWIGAGVNILDGVEIGENSVIGAGAVVAKNIPKNSIAVGNPVRIIKNR